MTVKIDSDEQAASRTITTFEELSSYFDLFDLSMQDRESIREAIALQGIKQSRDYIERLIKGIGNEKEKKQIGRLIFPMLEEINAAEIEDPLLLIGQPAKEKLHIKGLTQEYPDRVLVSLTSACFHNCIWCFRSKQIDTLTDGQLTKILDYIKERETIGDVILTGGEPLLFSNSKLDSILSEIRKIAHVDIIRFHSRTPVVYPERIDQEFIDILKKHDLTGKPIYLVTHIVHPLEINSKTIDCLERLNRIGIMVLNQAPIMKGINDDQATFDNLNKKLIKYKVKPYYAGLFIKNELNKRFFVSLKEAEDLISGYAAKYDGLGRPTLIMPVSGRKATAAELKQYMLSYGNLHIRITKN